MYKFYAFLSRMKYINRWSLMRNTRTESVAEHSHQTAVLAHALALIEQKIFNKKVDPNLCAAMAVFHETAEVLTGDLPTPVKYFNPQIKKAYKDVEKFAENKLLASLPKELKTEMTALVQPPDSLEKQLVKYADKLAALIKCIEELSGNNDEFHDAYQTTTDVLKSYGCDSVDYFLENFLDPFFMSIDGLSEE